MKKAAIVIGHTELSPGAHGSGTTEFIFNRLLARSIQSEVSEVEVDIIYRSTYSGLPNIINNYFRPDFIISLHCNAYNGSATGTETLYYHRSARGKKMAKILNNHIVGALGLKDRGIKPKTSEDRGGYLLRSTVAPCVIAEPFFIDNPDDFRVACDRRWELVRAYAAAILDIAVAI